MATSEDYSRSVTMASDELKDIFCEPCIEDGKQIQAQGFCVDCSEYLCGQCYKYHSRYKAFKHHVLQDKGTMPLDVRQAGIQDVCRERCALHPTKIVEYFCKSCETLGCNACITVNHRQCQNVNHIPDIVQAIETSEEFVEFTNRLDGKVEALTKRKENISSNKSETDEIRKQAREELKKQRGEINKFFDSLETEMDKKITDIDNRNRQTLKAASNRLDLINNELQRMKTDIETKKKNGQKCELFIAMKKSKSGMKHLDKEFNLLNKESKIQRYKPTQSKQIKDMIKNTTEICRLLTAELVSEINVSSSQDAKTPWIRGLAVVQQHCLAVADHDNKSIKVIDTRNGVLTSEMRKDCKYLWDVTNVDDDKIAVSMTNPQNQDTIEFLSVSETGLLTSRYEIKCSNTCYSLVSFKRNFCVRTTAGLEVMDTQGKILKSIEEKMSCYEIALGIDNECIYVVDSTNNKVQKMSLDGKVEVDKYLDGFLTGVTVDREGFVYVSCKKCVHQLTENLSEVQILSEGIHRKIAYSSRDNKLYVDGCTGLVQVYQMY